MKFNYTEWRTKLKQRDPLTPLERRFEKWPRRFQWLSDHLGQILSSLAAILIGISSVISSPSAFAWLLIAVGGVLLMLSVFHAAKRQSLLTQIETHYQAQDEDRLQEISEKTAHITQLKEVIADAGRGIETDRQAVVEVLREATVSMAQELDLWNTDTRLSLYRHSASTREFIRLARVSDNPDLEGAGRTAYPDNEGIISQAWQHGHAFSLDMPKTRGRWIQHQVRQFGLSRTTADELTMHAVWMLGFRIDYNGRKLGLVVVEGAKKDSLTPKGADDLQRSDLLQATIPRLLFASQVALRGYWEKNVSGMNL